MKPQQTTCVRINAALCTDAMRGIDPATVLSEIGVASFLVSPGRMAGLHRHNPLMALFRTDEAIADLSAQQISFFVPAESEAAAVNIIAHHFGADRPGNATVFSESLSISDAGVLDKLHVPASPASHVQHPLTGLAGICCIVQRGEGEKIVRVALESGGVVPWVRFGEGTGVRDKLGLLRITIPAEKEIIECVVPSQDADGIMGLMIDAGRLGEPGRGFIYRYPVGRGVINMKVALGRHRHAASMEQVIGAIDGLTGGIEWRERGISDNRHAHRWLTGLEEIRIICTEGHGARLCEAAMQAGAAGATIMQSRFVAEELPDGLLPAREECSLIIASPAAVAIVSALENAGVYAASTAGRIVRRMVDHAFTYTGRT